MNLYQLMRSSRSFRRFHQDQPISPATLRGLVDLARLSPTASNMQALRFHLSCDPARNALIFPNLGWAGYLTGWEGPPEGERPSAYITILLDKDVRQDAGCDHGIAAQSIMLGAAERGLGGCMIGSVRRKQLREVLGLADKFEILLVLALGVSKEEVVIEPLPSDGSVKYWRDAHQVHHVPKRSLEDLIIS